MGEKKTIVRKQGWWPKRVNRAGKVQRDGVFYKDGLCGSTAKKVNLTKKKNTKGGQKIPHRRERLTCADRKRKKSGMPLKGGMGFQTKEEL